MAHLLRNNLGGQSQCPQCNGKIPVSKSLFREGFRCPRCDVPLRVATVYSRVLVVLSAAASFIVLWELGLRDLRIFLLCLPVGVLILTVLVRVAPFLVAPRLDLGSSDRATSLDLFPRG